MESFLSEKEYLAQLRVYASKSLELIDEEFVVFFDAVDIDYALKNFIEAYWICPSKIRLNLVDLEEP